MKVIKNGEDTETKMTETKIITASSMPEFIITENWNMWQERLELHFVEIGCEENWRSKRGQFY